MSFPCDLSLFHKKDTCHWATASIVVADGFAILAFLVEDLTSLHSDCCCFSLFFLFFFLQNSAVVPTAAQCVVPMQIRYISYISSTISGLDHCTWPPQDKSQSIFLHTSLKHKEPKYKQKAGSLLYTEHNQ